VRLYAWTGDKHRALKQLDEAARFPVMNSERSVAGDGAALMFLDVQRIPPFLGRNSHRAA
jgi:hypothetical protein